MNILHLDASTSGVAESHTRRLSARMVDRLRSKHASATVVHRDLAHMRLPHVGASIRDAWSDDTENDAELEKLASRSKELVEELKAADAVVMGSPMYNFSVPSHLKAWIDHIVIAGQTFKYTDKGPEGLLEGKEAYLLLSAGGVYSEGPGASKDHLDTYLTDVMELIGVTNVTTIWAEGVALSPEREQEAMEQAIAEIKTI